MDQRDIYTSSISDIVHVHPLLLDAVLFTTDFSNQLVVGLTIAM